MSATTADIIRHWENAQTCSDSGRFHEAIIEFERSRFLLNEESKTGGEISKITVQLLDRINRELEDHYLLLGGNFYIALGVRKDCTKKIIRKAYKAFCVKYHPDKNLDINSTELFQIGQTAHEILSDGISMKNYYPTVKVGDWLKKRAIVLNDGTKTSNSKNERTTSDKCPERRKSSDDLDRSKTVKMPVIGRNPSQKVSQINKKNSTTESDSKVKTESRSKLKNSTTESDSKVKTESSCKVKNSTTEPDSKVKTESSSKVKNSTTESDSKVKTESSSKVKNSTIESDSKVKTNSSSKVKNSTTELDKRKESGVDSVAQRQPNWGRTGVVDNDEDVDFDMSFAQNTFLKQSSITVNPDDYSVGEDIDLDMGQFDLEESDNEEEREDEEDWNFAFDLNAIRWGASDGDDEMNSSPHQFPQIIKGFGSASQRQYLDDDDDEDNDDDVREQIDNCKDFNQRRSQLPSLF